MRTRWGLVVAKTLVWLMCLSTLFVLTWNFHTNNLGANPIEAITHSTGSWALILLVATLAITPLRRLFGWNVLARFRRLLGLFAFFYATLHLTTYVWLDKFFAVDDIVKDIAKRRFITVGLLAFAVMVPLAVTSTSGWIRRLGGRRWQMLHRLTYVAAVAVVVHFYWLVKSDVREPLTYAAIFAALFAYRGYTALRKAA